MDKKIDIRQLNLEDLKLKLTEFGEKPFRANQIYQWLWQKRATTFDEMTNLSLSLRKTVEDNFVINAIQLKEAQKSKDKTIKNAFLLSDDTIFHLRLNRFFFAVSLSFEFLIILIT